jgi:hypothetical protein
MPRACFSAGLMHLGSRAPVTPMSLEIVSIGCSTKMSDDVIGVPRRKVAADGRWSTGSAIPSYEVLLSVHPSTKL